MVAARGAGEHERSSALGVQHADDLGDHAAHRRADDVGRVDALGVEDRHRVARHLVERVRARRLPREAGAPVVGCEAAVAAAERHALEGPAAGVGPEALDHQERLAVALAPDVVGDLDAVVGDHRVHADLPSPLGLPVAAGCLLAANEMLANAHSSPT